MHFTAGAPLRILADVRDSDAYRCPPGHPPYVCPGTELRFYVDGRLVGSVPPSPDDFDLWELRLPAGLPQGDHALTVSYVPYDPATHSGAAAVNGSVPVIVHVDAAAVHPGSVTLTGDLALSGSTDLNWIDKSIFGNGFKITASPGFSGRITIRNSSVSGLGSFSAAGMSIATSGSISITDSVFEATGEMKFGARGSAAITIRNNELRANNLMTYVSANPAVPVMLELDGNDKGAKLVQGNRIGGGILLINEGDGWQIGGLAPGEGNILMGVRAVLAVDDSSHDRIQGNYLLHDYHGGFSQGFNLWLQGRSSGELAEHNVIIGGSWPVQSFAGEFRYNLMVDSGHTFWRGAGDGTRIHHNLFVHATGSNTQYDGAIFVYAAASGLEAYNNTVDAGGATAAFNAPAFNIGADARWRSIRNNLFTGFSNVRADLGGAFVSTSGNASALPRVGAADYNGWYNPLAEDSTRYLGGIVQKAAGAHDVQKDPHLAGSAEVPYRMPAGCIWLGQLTTGEVLSHYRQIYRPSPGSPLIGAGDPADGPQSFIGAIGPNDDDPVDLFGRVLR